MRRTRTSAGRQCRRWPPSAEVHGAADVVEVGVVQPESALNVRSGDRVEIAVEIGAVGLRRDVGVPGHADRASCGLPARMALYSEHHLEHRVVRGPGDADVEREVATYPFGQPVGAFQRPQMHLELAQVRSGRPAGRQLGRVRLQQPAGFDELARGDPCRRRTPWKARAAGAAPRAISSSPARTPPSSARQPLTEPTVRPSMSCLRRARKIRMVGIAARMVPAMTRPYSRE